MHDVKRHSIENANGINLVIFFIKLFFYLREPVLEEELPVLLLPELELLEPAELLLPDPELLELPELLLTELELLLTELDEREVAEDERLTLDEEPEGVVVLILVRAVPELLTLLLTVVCPLLEEDAASEDLLTLDPAELLLPPPADAVPVPLDPEADAAVVAEREVPAEAPLEPPPVVLEDVAVLVTDSASTASRRSRAFVTVRGFCPETLRAGVFALRSMNERSGYLTP